jgi:hypothetical protein
MKMMVEVRKQTVDMVYRKRAALALPVLSRLHHEVLEGQLAMLFEQVCKC